MNIQNDGIGLVLREICKSKQMTDFIAWPSRCHDKIHDFTNGSCHEYTINLRYNNNLSITCFLYNGKASKCMLK